mgnify:CR=1 FL=1
MFPVPCLTASHDKIQEIYVAEEMIPHRRRGFEYETMIYELLVRASIKVPKQKIPKFLMGDNLKDLSSGFSNIKA